MPYFIENSEIHFDFNDSLNHFQGVTCELNFKPHQRRRIIKQANQQSKEAFQKFKNQIDPYLERYSIVQDKIRIRWEESKLFNEYEDAINQRAKLYTDRDELHDLLRRIAHKCFSTYLYVSPSLHFFSPSFHIVKELLVLASAKNNVFELNWNDSLPVRRTQWNTHEKLFAFLLARKRYFFDCYFYTKRYHEKKSSTCYPDFSEEQKRLLILFLVDENYVEESDEKLCYYFLNGYEAYRKITWLKSAIELTFLVFQLKIKWNDFSKPYHQGYSTTGAILYYFQNPNNRELKKSTLSQYMRRFEDPEDCYPENAKLTRIKKMLETLKTENSRKLLYLS